MQIFIMRHGQAHAHTGIDSQCQLTPQGVWEAELMGQWMEKMAIQPDMLWISPYVRAQQTGEALITYISSNVQQLTTDLIIPSGSALKVHDFIDGELSTNNVAQLMLISHMPIVSYLVSELTQHQQAPIFQTAGIVEIAYDPQSMTGELINMVSPTDL